MKRKAFVDTSSSTSFCQQVLRSRSGDGEADQRLVEAVDANRAVLRQLPLEPAHVVFLRGRRSPDHERLHRRSLAMVKSPISLPNSLSIGVSTRRPGLRHAVGHQPVEEILGAWA